MAKKVAPNRAAPKLKRKKSQKDQKIKKIKKKTSKKQEFCETQDPALDQLPQELLAKRTAAAAAIAAVELTSDTCIKLCFKSNNQQAKEDTWPTLKAALNEGLSGQAHIATIRWIPTKKKNQVMALLRLRCLEDTGQSSSTSTIILGPSASDAKAVASFHQLWGKDKCQLRRFEDGSVKESIEINNPWGNNRREVAIVAYLADRAGVQAEPLLLSKKALPFFILDGSHLMSVRKTLAELSALLVDNADPSLPLRRVRGLGPIIYGGESSDASRAPPTVGKTIVVEKRGCFLLKKQTNIVPSLCKAIPVTLDITHRKNLSPETFKLLRTAYLMSVMKTLAGQSVVAKLRGDKLYVLFQGKTFALDVDPPDTLVDHSHGDLSSLQNYLQSVGLRFGPVWRGAAHLLRTWLSAKMMEASVPGVLVDILLAHVLLRPLTGLSPPRTPEAAVIRVLDLLSFYDFTLEPLVLDEEDELRGENGPLETAQRLLVTRRNELPALVVLTCYDGPSLLSSFSKSLSAPDAQRLINLARQALHALTTSGEGPDWNSFEQTCLVPCSLTLFDVVIHLKPLLMANRKRADTQTKEETGESGTALKALPIVDFDPVQLYLDELRAAYGTYGRFYHGSGLANIGVKLEVSTLKGTAEESLKNCHGRHLSSHGDLVPNIEAFVADLTVLGGDLVKSVEVNNARL